MTHTPLAAVRGLLALGCAAIVAGCAAVPGHTVHLGPEAGNAPRPTLSVTPATIPMGGSAVVRIHAPGADSVVLQSRNGVDQYWAHGEVLTARINGMFGIAEPGSAERYAVREHGVLFSHVKRPVTITACRARLCHTYHDALTIKLPERNERSVALTGGWATVFTRRAITDQDRSVLLRQAVNNSAWHLQAEVATRGFNARVHGYHGTDERGIALDISQTFKTPAANTMGYGLAVHLASRKADWLTDDIAASLSDRTVYQASIGPSLMLKGVSASSQLGFYTDGEETLQVLSTFVSLNGNLTEITTPFTLTVEKTFAFGGNGIIPRRRDGAERMTIGWKLTPRAALRLGMHTRRSAWPVDGSAEDIQVSESYYSIGAQYTLSW